MATLFGMFPFLQKLFADSGYQGPEFSTALAKVRSHLNVEIVKRSDRAKGFVVFSKRWIVERTLAWLDRCRRLAKDLENRHRKALAFLHLASMRLMLRGEARQQSVYLIVASTHTAAAEQTRWGNRVPSTGCRSRCGLPRRCNAPPLSLHYYWRHRSAHFASASSARRRAMSGRRPRSVEGTETRIFGMRPASGCIASQARRAGCRSASRWRANCACYTLYVEDLRSSSPAIKRAEMRQGLVSLAPTTLCRGSG